MGRTRKAFAKGAERVLRAFSFGGRGDDLHIVEELITVTAFRDRGTREWKLDVEELWSDRRIARWA